MSPMMRFFLLYYIATLLFLISLSEALNGGHVLRNPRKLAQSSYVTHSIMIRPHLASRMRYSPYRLCFLKASNINNPATETSKPSEPLSDAMTLRNQLKGTNVFFVGMMGSGKSTVAKAFADKLLYRYLDTDEIAEFLIQMPINEFFAQGREEEFRNAEYQVLMEMSQYTRLSLATGGGIVEKNENWGMLRHGIVVHLHMTPEDIYERLKAAGEDEVKKRPLLASSDPLAKLKELSEKRQEKYDQADVRVEVRPGMSPDEIADKTVTTILDFIKSNPPMWSTWKKQRDAAAVEAAARANPSATAAAGVGFGEGVPKGTIQHVSIQDIQSGKVQLPTSKPESTNFIPTVSNENTEKKSGKGFQRDPK